MNETQHSISEAAQRSGIPAEEIHGRIWRGEIPGTAMPGNRQAGFVNGTTLEKLVQEGQLARRQTPTPIPVRMEWFQTMTLDEAAAELGISTRDVEGLLSQGELEGIFLHPRWSSVRRASLDAYRASYATTPE